LGFTIVQSRSANQDLMAKITALKTAIEQAEAAAKKAGAETLASEEFSAATVLFDEARALMKDGQLAAVLEKGEACRDKFWLARDSARTKTVGEAREKAEAAKTLSAKAADMKRFKDAEQLLADGDKALKEEAKEVEKGKLFDRAELAFESAGKLFGDSLQEFDAKAAAI